MMLILVIVTVMASALVLFACWFLFLSSHFSVMLAKTVAGHHDQLLGGQHFGEVATGVVVANGSPAVFGWFPFLLSLMYFWICAFS